MTLNEIDTYLNASRGYIENSKRRLASLGFCCPTLFLADLENRQTQLERIAWAERQRQANGMGILPIYWIGAIIVSLSTLGTYVYSIFQQSKIQSDYLNCLDRLKDMDPQEAAAICSGQKGESTKDDITKTIKIAIYGAVAVMALYLASKFVGKKR